MALNAFLVGIQANYLTHSFQLGQHTKKQIWVMLGMAVVNVALNYILIPKYGYFGATIAQTVAYHYYPTKQLGASFFCSGDDTDYSNVRLVFPTMAYELCSFNPIFQERVSEAMHKGADLQSALPSTQLEKLVVELWRL